MSLSLEDIWGGLLGIEHLVLCTDYAMWLAVEYDGCDEKTPIRIHCNLERERDTHINEFLADHREKLDRDECPNCGRQQRGIAPDKCPDCGVKRDDEFYIREWAWKRLRFSAPGLQARCAVPAYLSNDLCGSYTANPSGDVDVPLAVARASLLRHVTKLRKDSVRKCWDHLCISTSQDLIPNDSSPEAHQRYLANRQKLVNGYNWLTGIANQYPEFTEDYESHTGVRTFPPPIEMRDAPVVKFQSAQVGGALDVQTPAAKPPALAPKSQPSDAAVRLLNVYTNGLADERLEKVRSVLDSKQTVDDKLQKIDELMPIPPSVSAPKLGKALGVSKTAVQNTSWYIQKRKGRKDEKIDEREGRLRQRG